MTAVGEQELGATLVATTKPSFTSSVVSTVDPTTDLNGVPTGPSFGVKDGPIGTIAETAVGEQEDTFSLVNPKKMFAGESRIDPTQ